MKDVISNAIINRKVINPKLIDLDKVIIAIDGQASTGKSNQEENSW